MGQHTFELATKVSRSQVREFGTVYRLPAAAWHWIWTL